MRETPKSRLSRRLFNLFPCYWSTGARITFISGDFRLVRVRLPLNWRTRNIVGTIFGGSMFAATDPIYMTMFLRLLGKDYVVWDKAGSIRFRKPGRSTLYAEFRVDEEMLEAIRRELEEKEKLERTFSVTLADRDGVVHAEVERVLHFRKR